MKTAATKKITKEKRTSILSKIESLFIEKNDELFDNSLFEFIRRCFPVSGIALDDYYTNYRFMYTDNNDWSLSGQSSGGSYHSMSVYNGVMTVSHSGSRGSFPGLLTAEICFDNNNKKDSFFDSKNEWKLVQYETSEPTWAPVLGFLFGTFGQTGPSNQFEADLIERDKIKSEIETALYNVSDNTRLNVLSELCQDWDYMLLGDIIPVKELVKKSLTGIDYRRLSAVGVRI